jgi:aminoglycoside phosphotransferase (APT) family kinase protein
VTPDRSSLDDLRRDLDWAVGQELPGWSVESIRSLGAGRSAVTAAAGLRRPDGSVRAVAVRATLGGDPGLSIASLTDQYQLLDILYRNGLPVPQPVLVVEASSRIRHDLLVTEFVAGDIPDPWRSAGRARIAELRHDERFVADFVDTLARIHAVLAESLPGELKRDSAVAAGSYPALSRRRSQSSIGLSAAFRDDPVLTYTSLWLEAHDTCARGPGGLVHGDYRMGNLVVRDGRLVGVLDWELAEAGETISDVAWLCGPQGYVDGCPAGLFPGPEELVARYQRATGHAVDQELFRYLTVAGTLRTAGVWAQLSVDESRHGNAANAARRRDSVLELIRMCAQVLGLSSPPRRAAEPAGHQDLLGALGAEAQVVLDELERELAAAAAPAGPATYGARLFLRRFAAVSASPDYGDFAAGCRVLLERLGCDHAQARLAPASAAGSTLSHALRQHGAAGPDAHRADLEAETRGLVGWAAEPAIAYANMVFALARARLEPAEPEPDTHG